MKFVGWEIGSPLTLRMLDIFDEIYKVCPVKFVRTYPDIKAKWLALAGDMIQHAILYNSDPELPVANKLKLGDLMRVPQVLEHFTSLAEYVFEVAARIPDDIVGKRQELFGGERAKMFQSIAKYLFFNCDHLDTEAVMKEFFSSIVLGARVNSSCRALRHRAIMNITNNVRI